MIKRISFLLILLPFPAFSSVYEHPEQSRCDYLSLQINDIQHIYQNDPKNISRYLRLLRDYRLEFERRRCPLTSDYLMHGNGNAHRMRVSSDKARMRVSTSK